VRFVRPTCLFAVQPSVRRRDQIARSGVIAKCLFRRSVHSWIGILLSKQANSKGAIGDRCHAIELWPEALRGILLTRTPWVLGAPYRYVRVVPRYRLVSALTCQIKVKKIDNGDHRQPESSHFGWLPVRYYSRRSLQRTICTVRVKMMHMREFATEALRYSMYCIQTHIIQIMKERGVIRSSRARS
jgi:hypothetical protein